jgi:hypothetical protein
MWTTRAIDYANRFSLVLLAIGGVIGVLLGILSALWNVDVLPSAALPEDAIALVNGKAIRAEEYESAMALFAGDKRSALTDEDRAHVLTRLIEGELLVQHGIAGGIVDTDRSVRKAMTQALMDSIVAESAVGLPSEEELQAFYRQHRSLFSSQTTTETVTFRDVREQVEAAFLQRARDEALREYLSWLRAEAKVVLAPEVMVSENPSHVHSR